jgi:hypothetical protein
MGTVRVLPTAKATPEVLLRWLLAEHEQIRGMVIVSFAHDGTSSLCQTRGLSKGEQSFAAVKLAHDVMEGEWGEVLEGEECPEPAS